MKTKIKNMFNWPRFIALLGLLILIVLSVSHPLGAQTVTEGFSSDKQLQRGMLVSIDQKDKNKIEATSKDNAKNLYGVVVGASDSAVTLSADGQQYFVATAGNFDVLVSNQNGNIKKGDDISISAIPGIGYKSSNKDAVLVGKSLADYDPNKDTVSSAKLKDAAGKEFDISLFRVPVQIKIAGNPNLKSNESELPNSLRKITDALAGKQTTAFRAYIALAVFVLSSVAASSLLYGGVKSAIISVGRNPLSKKSITRSMLQVVASGLVIFITGLFGVYLILRL